MNDFEDDPGLCVDGKVNAKLARGLLAGLPARIAELEGNLLSVVATTEEGPIAPFSNRCGIAADWCLAAPGEGDPDPPTSGPIPDSNRTGLPVDRQHIPEPPSPRPW